jgi:hypothetical protein
MKINQGLVLHPASNQFNSICSLGASPAELFMQSNLDLKKAAFRSNCDRNERKSMIRALVWRMSPWLATALIFALLLERMRLGQVYGALREVPYLKFAALFLPLALLYLLLDSFCLKWILGRFNAKIGFRDIVPVRASMYLPAIINNNLGFAGVSYYLYRRFGVRFFGGLSSVLFTAFIDVYVMILFSTIGVAFFFRPTGPDLQRLVSSLTFVYGAAWLFLAMLIVVGALARRRPAVRAWITHTRVGAFAGTFIRAKPLDYLVLLGVKMVGFGCAILVQYATMAMYGLAVPIGKLMALVPLVYLAAAIPLTVAQLGPGESVWIMLFANEHTAGRMFAYIIAAHLIFIGSLALIGFCFLRRASRDLIQARPVKDDENDGPTARPMPPHRSVSVRGKPYLVESRRTHRA